MPSARPIRSSWLTAPLAVWNWPPALSTTEWRRPFGSVRVTRSPARNGPRLTPEGTSSAIPDSEQSELPARAKSEVTDGDARAGVQVFLALAHRQQHIVHGSLLLQG